MNFVNLFVVSVSKLKENAVSVSCNKNEILK